MRHANIALFVPHVGCKHRCSFCDQNTITGTERLPHAEDVDRAVEIALESGRADPQKTEIAFFGGSFTAIERDYMNELLDAAAKYVHNGTVSGIRLSTRPDAIDDEILELLGSKGVTAIELGAQSMDDEVLRLNARGHSAEQVREAALRIREHSFTLGLQMMTGLYGSSREKDRQTAEELIALSPEQVRIYPTLILDGTALGELYRQGKYRTYSLEESVELCAGLLKRFFENGISVIRLGLHTVDSERYLSGPWHPAFRELCESELYFKEAAARLSSAGSYTLTVAPSAVSKMTGQNKANIARLSALGFDCRVRAEAGLKEYEVRITGR